MLLICWTRICWTLKILGQGRKRVVVTTYLSRSVALCHTVSKNDRKIGFETGLSYITFTLHPLKVHTPTSKTVSSFCNDSQALSVSVLMVKSPKLLMVRHKDNEVILHFTDLGDKVIACMCQTGTHVRFSYIVMLTFLTSAGQRSCRARLLLF